MFFLCRWFDEIKNLFEYSAYGQFGEAVPEKIPFVRPDKDAPNLFLGKEIGDSTLKGKVISFDENNIEMEIIELNDKHGRFERYFDIGKRYPIFRHQHWTFERGLMLWEVEPSSMKRDVSQILLQWEEGIGWTWDLDM